MENSTNSGNSGVKNSTPQLPDLVPKFNPNTNANSLGLKKRVDLGGSGPPKSSFGPKKVPQTPDLVPKFNPNTNANSLGLKKRVDLGASRPFLQTLSTPGG